MTDDEARQKMNDDLDISLVRRTGSTKKYEEPSLLALQNNSSTVL
jgi:hypothetical protein